MVRSLAAPKSYDIPRIQTDQLAAGLSADASAVVDSDIFQSLLADINRGATTIIGQQLSLRELRRVLEFRAAHPPAPLASALSDRALVITGPPRSATTTLQLLLSIGCGWQTPSGVALAFGSNDKPEVESDLVSRARQRSNLFHLSSPQAFRMHRVPVRQGDECSVGLMNYLCGIQPLLYWHSPNYLNWLVENDGEIEYSCYLRFLTQIGLLGGNREAGAATPTVLKAPGHEMFLPTIRRLLPNAIFVRISREPEARIRSWTQLAVQLRRLFGQPSGASELQFWEQLWREGADLFSDLPSRFRIDLSFQDVIENPYRVALRLAAAIDAEPPRRARVERAAALLRSLASQP